MLWHAHFHFLHNSPDSLEVQTISRLQLDQTQHVNLKKGVSLSSGYDFICSARKTEVSCDKKLQENEIILFSL